MTALATKPRWTVAQGWFLPSPATLRPSLAFRTAEEALTYWRRMFLNDLEFYNRWIMETGGYTAIALYGTVAQNFETGEVKTYRLGLKDPSPTGD